MSDLIEICPCITARFADKKGGRVLVELAFMNEM